MIVRKGDIIELWVERMAFGGKGVARLDGFVIFVHGGVPGDRLLAKIIKKRKGHAEAHIFELIHPSEDRIQAPCPYSDFCGGCQWQYIKYKRQLQYKMEHVKEAMERIGSLKNIHIHNTIPSTKIFEYRNKMEFSFSDRKWILPARYNREENRQGFGLGLHIPGTFHKVIDIEKCLLQKEKGNFILQEIRKYVRDSRIPVYGLKSHEGFWRFVTLRHSRATDKWMVNLVTTCEKPDIVKPLAKKLCQEITDISTVTNNINSGKANIAFGETENILMGKGFIIDRIGPFKFQISPNSFFQTNTQTAEILYEKVFDFAELKGNEIILDLYSGTGTIPIYLSRMAKEIIGIEIVESAISDAHRNCEINGIQNCKFIHGDIRDRLTSLKLIPDVLIIDPPRAGMHKDIVATILEMGIEKVIYISCNPSTLARDICLLSKSYVVTEIQPIDMFPHTYHIESVAKLKKRTGNNEK